MLTDDQRDRNGKVLYESFETINKAPWEERARDYLAKPAPGIPDDIYEAILRVQRLAREHGHALGRRGLLPLNLEEAPPDRIVDYLNHDILRPQEQVADALSDLFDKLRDWKAG